jgi:putative ABC transport system ATP-binding protein
MLIASNISHSFDYQLFNDINISLLAGKSTAIIGASGSGKSTLLHILSSFLKPNAGSVSFDDKNMYESGENELIRLRREEFGVIFQSHYLFRGFTGYENIKIAELLSKTKLDETICKRFGIDEVLHQSSSTLSGGQQQRMSIVRVLTKQPKIIFADEPTGNLDNITASEVMHALFEYISEKSASMLCVTHDEAVAYSCDSVFRLQDRQLIKTK